MRKRLDPANQALGPCTGHQIDGQRITFDLAEARVELQVYRSDILRLRAVAKEEDFEDFSYAVIREPEKTAFDWSSTETGWLLSTQMLDLEVQANPLRFTLKDKGGKTLLADDPAFGISRIGREWYNYKQLRDDEIFIGLGEKTGHLNRRGKWYQHWNTDAFAYGEEDDPLYMSTPFYMGICNQAVYGVFVDSTYRSIFNFGASNHRFSYFQVPDGGLDQYLFASGGVSETVAAYGWLTGTSPLPPKWSLGYQQCRYSYYPDKEVLNVARTFREKHIPCDVIYLDIHYMDQYKLFTWNNKEFPDPEAFVRALLDMNFQVVVIIDPGVKVEVGYHAYESGKDKDLFVKFPDGTYYSGDVWPGTCHFPDFTMPETRAWWGEQFTSLAKMGIKGFWNDMNEPVTWGKKLPDLIEFDFDGMGATHRKAHNVYGMQMARATAEGVKKLMPDTRAFVLSRAGYSGSQRFAASWTGDNSSSDDHMLLGVRLMLNMGLAGLSFTGVDIGGFVGEANPQLFTRWMQIGAFSPLFRGHTMINSRDSEPWSYGEEAEEISRNFIRLRYRLMPYLYTAFHESSETGLPVVRSLAFDYWHDANIFDRRWGHEYLFGNAMLVAAVNSWLPIQKVYLPEGIWYDLYNGHHYKGNQVHTVETPREVLPVFVKESAVLPMQLPGEYVDGASKEHLDLHIFGGYATFQGYWYNDDGNGFGFEKGEFEKRTMLHKGEEKKLVLGPSQGSFDSGIKHIRLHFHGIETAEVILNGKAHTIQYDKVRFIEPISNFDPFFTGGEHPWEHAHVATVTLPYDRGQLEIKY